MSTQIPPVRLTRLSLGRSPKRLSYERRLRLWLAGLALPALIPAAVLAWITTHSWEWVAGTAGGLSIAWAIAAMYLFDQFMRPLQTLSNVVSALREDDFSFRARGGRRNDSLGDLALEINGLAGMLQVQKTSARDALTLLERVMGSLPSPVLAFDPQQHLRMMNQASEELFGLSRRDALGRTAAELDLLPLLALEDQALYNHAPHAQRAAVRSARSAPASTTMDPLGQRLAATRWSVRRAGFRLQGTPHTLLVLSDVAAALREEERVAWQRLIRVLSHEINNSLTPIHSIAGSLRERLEDDGRFALDSTGSHDGSHDVRAKERQAVAPRRATFSANPVGVDAGLTADAIRGLRIIEERAASLNRFLQAYQQLTRLPPPLLRTVDLLALLEGVAALESRVPVQLTRGQAASLLADPDQLGQLLINLIRNAAEASLQSREMPSPDTSASFRNQAHAPEVKMTWTLRGGRVSIAVRDNGPGLTNPANLFVPFYTTKPNGTGVGLVLARQIAVAHHGTLTLTNRTDGITGCVAELQLPAE